MASDNRNGFLVNRVLPCCVANGGCFHVFELRGGVCLNAATSTASLLVQSAGKNIGAKPSEHGKKFCAGFVREKLCGILAELYQT